MIVPTYKPQPGSKADQLIQVLRSTAMPWRTPDLAKQVDCKQDAVQPLLASAVAAGMVTCCKVEVPGRRQMNEYRSGPGRPPIAGAADLKPQRPTIIPIRLPSGPAIDNQPDQPAVSHNTGSPRGAPSSDTVKAPARAVAMKAPQAKLPHSAKPAVRNEIHISLDSRATLTIHRDVGTSIFSADEVLEIGDYLHATQGIWRP